MPAVGAPPGSKTDLQLARKLQGQCCGNVRLGSGGNTVLERFYGYSDRFDRDDVFRVQQEARGRDREFIDDVKAGRRPFF